MHRLIIIGARTTGASVTLVHAALRREMNVTVISASHEPLDGAFPPQVEVAYMEPRLDIVVYWLRERYPDEYAERQLHVTTTHDNYARLAAQVADYAGLPGPAAAQVAHYVSKIRQKPFLARNGLPTAAFVAGSLNDLPALLDKVGKLSFPLVVKPAEGSASDGVRLCSDLNQVTQHLAALAQLPELHSCIEPCDDVIVEAYLPGEEYCVELFDGQYVGAVRKLKQQGKTFQEHGYTSELDLDEATLQCLADTGQRAVELAGLSWGPVHIDCIVSDGIPHIIELNPRIAGSFICEVVRDSYGFDAVASLLDKLLGRRISIPVVLRPAMYVRVELLLENDGGFREFADNRTIKGDPVSISYGLQRLRNHKHRAFVYERAAKAIELARPIG